MMQQMSFGPRASMGASLYENEAVKEDGVWKFRVDPHVQHVDGRLRRRLGKLRQRRAGPEQGRFRPTRRRRSCFRCSRRSIRSRSTIAHPAGPAGHASRQNFRGEQLQRWHQQRLRPGMPPEIAAELATIGPADRGAANGRALRAAAAEGALSSAHRHPRRSYGPHERNVLDVFTSRRDPGEEPQARRRVRAWRRVRARREAYCRARRSTTTSALGRRRTGWSASPSIIGSRRRVHWPSGIEDLGASSRG